MFDCWWTRFGYNEFLCWLKWRLTLSTSCVFFHQVPLLELLNSACQPGFWGKPRWNFSTDSDSCVLREIDVVRNRTCIGIGFEKTHFLYSCYTYCVWHTHKFMQPCSQLFRSFHPGNASQLRLVWRCHLLNHGFSQFFRFVKQRNGRGKIHGKSNKKSVHVITDGSIWGWLL